MSLMSVDYQYNKIISTIEELINRQPIPDTREIALKAAQCLGMSFREANCVFRFLTGQSLQDYVRRQRMMYVYKKLINDEEYSVSIDAVADAGYETQSSFSNAFKNTFYVTTGEAKKDKDLSRYEPPLYWDLLLHKLSPEDGEEKMGSMVNCTDTIFGIPREQYQIAQEAADLQELFEFDDVLANFAFEIKQKYPALPLKNAFDYVDYATRFFGVREHLDAATKQRLMNKTLLSLSIEYGLYMEDAANTCADILEMGETIDTIPEEVLEYYVDSTLEDRGIKELTELYWEMVERDSDVPFEDFMHQLDICGGNLDVAARDWSRDLY